MVYVTKKSKGFTLIELLVVIAIIGILSTIAMLAFNVARSKARDVRRLSDIRQISTALAMYKDAHSTYVNPGSSWYYANSNNQSDWSTLSGYLSPYFENGSAPKDPANDNLYFYAYTNTPSNGGSPEITMLRYSLENDNPNIGLSNTGVDNGVRYYNKVLY